MHQTQRRSRGCLRVLRTDVVRLLHPIANCAPDGLLERLRGSTHAGRRGYANGSSTQRARRAGQCVLLLRQRRALRRSSGRRVVHVAFAVFDPVHRRVRGRVDCVGRLVWPGCETAEHQSTVRNPLLFRPIHEC